MMTIGAMSRPVLWSTVGLATAVTMGVVGAGDALAGLGQPTPGAIGLQDAASPVKEYMHWFHDQFLLPIITVITLFVGGLLVYAMWAFSEKRNPTPSKTTHHVGLEVAWTVIPVVILLIIAIPSFRLLYLEQTIPRADLTIKTTGSTWKWEYQYPDHGNFSFVSVMLNEQEINQRVARGEPRASLPRLLAVDNEVVVPVNKVVRVQVTAADVLHAFAMPSFGVKIDAVPGRLNETWFRATKEGIFYGQCSELCGKDHAFMPIAIRVVSEAAFATWVAEARRRFAEGRPPATIAELQGNRLIAANDTAIEAAAPR